MRRDMQQQRPSPGGGAQVHGVRAYVSPWRRRARLVFLATALTSVVFTLLAGATYTAFRRLAQDIKALPGDPAGLPTRAWIALFDSGAASAAFAFILTIVSIVSAHEPEARGRTKILSSVLLFCARPTLAHPGHVLSRSFLVAASWFTGLHVLNIASQFDSFQPLLDLATSNLGVSFNKPLLTATVAIGYLDAVLYFILGIALVMWKEHPDLLQVDLVPEGQLPSSTV